MAEKNSNFFTFERYQEILDYLKVHKRATVDELAKILYVSPATVRRDLTEMQKLNIIQRTHGGALYVDNNEDVSIFVRMNEGSSSKRDVAQVALKHIPEFRTCFIDNSSTSYEFAKMLDMSYKTVVTNGIHIATTLCEREDIEVIFLGGVIKYNSYATNGNFATDMLEHFRFDLMICGAAGVRPDGTYERSRETMEVKKIAMERSEKKILLVDSTKFKNNFLYRVGALEEYDAIFTDLTDEEIAPYKEKGIKIFNK
ncbi:MAG: DeoR/GlpR transcriptional regulator [Bacilli bacterium]|nr:DeoR/GlpR transcriptional regulator [Bacilli bacterium]